VIAHYPVNLPFRLATNQMRVITLGAGDDPASVALVKYAKDTANELRVHTMLVVGPRDTETGDAIVCLHGKDNGAVGSKAQASGGFFRA